MTGVQTCALPIYNISRVCSELDKLFLIIGKAKKITPELIEQNIGISKDFNNFELLKAVISKDIYKANLICNFFAKDPKNNPLVLSLTVLFGFFSNLMLAYYSKDKSENGLASDLGLRSSYASRDYILAMKNYNAFKTMQIISLIRNYDAKSKGFNGNSISEYELLKELLYMIMH